VLIYRVEDVRPGSPGHALLSADVEAISGVPVSDFPIQNAGQFRNSHELYRAFLQRLRLPTRLLDRIYDEPVVRRFYSDQELEQFRRRWLTGAVD